MKNFNQPLATFAAMVVIAGSTVAQGGQAKVGTEEFGLSPRQLVAAVERVEELISYCMQKQGFQYVAADYATVRQGMSADKKLPGMNEEEFIEKLGYGVSTVYTGKPPQLSEGYSPAKVGLGKRNIEIFRGLSPADQVAYNRALFGEDTSASFAIGLEIENFSRTGGCTREAVSKVFKPEQLKVKYYNPKDALVNKHPRMRAALRYYHYEMRKAGYNYHHPDEVEPDIRNRLAAITRGGTIPVEKMSAEQLAALNELRVYELKAAKINYKFATEHFDPVEEAVLQDLYARKVQ